MTISRQTYRGGAGKRHALNVNNTPVCGGGYGAKSAHWQQEFTEDISCSRCAAILARRKAKSNPEPVAV